jgi:hypothetical protein
MTAVSIDAAVARSRGFIPIANPIAPIDKPFSITAGLVPGYDSAVVTPSESAPAYDLATLTVSVVVPDIALAEVAPSVSVPDTGLASVFPANTLPSDLPPFPLNHPRILYQNRLDGSGVSATTGTNANRTLIPNTADRWAFSVDGSITYTLAGTQDVDSIGIGAHNLSGCTVTATYNSGTAFASVVAVNNIAIFFHLSASVAASDITISIAGVGATARFIGAVYSGIALQMQRPYFAGTSPINLNRVTKFYSSRTETGNVIGREIRSQNFETSADFKNLTNDWYRAYFDPFVESARRYPYFYAWNLEGYPLDVGYCETTEDISPSYQGTRDLMSVGFGLLGVG